MSMEVFRSFVMFVYILSYLLFCPLCGCLKNAMSVLWDEETPMLRRGWPSGSVLSPENMDIFRKLLKLPFTANLKSDAWYKLLEDTTVRNVTLLEWQELEPLIPYIPPQFLQEIDVTNDNLIEFFGSIDLKQEQLATLAEMASSVRGKDLFKNERNIHKLGNIFCGLSNEDIENIDIKIFQSLIKNKFFRHIRGCSFEKLNLLSRKAQSFTILGPPRTWKPETVKNAGRILAGFDSKMIRQISPECFRTMSKNYIEMIPLKALRSMRKEQLLMLPPSSLVHWRRKTQDFRHLHSNSNLSGESIILTSSGVIFAIMYKMSMNIEITLK